MAAHSAASVPLPTSRLDGVRPRPQVGMRVIALTGFAGVGKTAMLARLAAAGEQVLDLEELAAHRGSSFGRIGLTAPQPSEPDFHALVRTALAAFDDVRPVWLEDEGPHIGSLWLPLEVTAAIAAAETVEVTAPFEDRVWRLTATYGCGERAELIDATQRIRRRLGNSRTDRAISHFHAGRPEAAIRVVLEHFDRGYARRAARDVRRRLPPDEVPDLVRPATLPTRMGQVVGRSPPLGFRDAIGPLDGTPPNRRHDDAVHCADRRLRR
jgi:tRNA 2-selenouridine synthase